MKAWDGRFKESTDKRVEVFTESLSIDKRLYREDIMGSIAHAEMLAHINIITTEECNSIKRGLKELETDIAENRVEFLPTDEDIHMAIERLLTDKIGKPAKKLHTGRSRNDQIALDERLYLRRIIKIQEQELLSLLQEILRIANGNQDTLMPGYTHLQPAQPVSLAHFLLAYFEKFRRDFEAMNHLFDEIQEMPLGAGALAGSTLSLDPNFVRTMLGFARLTRNSMDAVSDRDLILKYLSVLSISGVHLSCFAEEFILWSSPAWGFIELPEAFSTGSSMMPQKKNPDIFELIRARAGKIFASLMQMLITSKSLPLTYNRDLQEDKNSFITAQDTLSSMINIFTAVLPHIKFNKDRMRASLYVGYITATDCAEALVKKGMAFREAHSVVGKWVARAIEKNKQLSDFQEDELMDISSSLTNDIIKRSDIMASLERKKTPGSPGYELVHAAIREAEIFLKDK